MLLSVSNPGPGNRQSSFSTEPRDGLEAAFSGRLGWLLAGVGVGGLVAAVATSPSDAGAAASQDWPPFVLVTGLLLIGLVADDDGLFAAAGHRLARVARSGTVLFLGATVMVGVVTAVLNLDTSVAFLTPVLVYTARSRGEGEAPLLYGCLLLSNVGSLFLPGSNLTNLIVLGHLHLSGAAFLARMWAPALVALVVTAVVVAVFEHRALRVSAGELTRPERPVLGLGLIAVVVATVLVVVLPSPALPVAIRGRRGRRHPTRRRQGSAPARGRGARSAGAHRLVRRGRGARHTWAGCGRGQPRFCRTSTWGNGRGRSRQLGVGQQPSRRIAARRPHPRPPLFAAHRAQPRAKPVRDRISRLAAVATSGAECRGTTLDRQGEPRRSSRSPTLDGCGARSPRPDRVSVERIFCCQLASAHAAGDPARRAGPRRIPTGGHSIAPPNLP